jgi:hypothetical protein
VRAHHPISGEPHGDPIPAGSDVSSGTYSCTNCGYEQVGSTEHLPLCPQCSNGEWKTITGGDAADDATGRA